MSVFNKVAFSFMLLVGVLANAKQFFAMANHSPTAVNYTEPGSGGTGQ